MTSGNHIEHVASWCNAMRLPLERRGDALWLPNPAAPRYGVLIRDADGDTEWSMPFPIPAVVDRMEATQRALSWLNQRPGPGAWELLPDRTVRYRLVVPASQLANSAALMASLRAVLDAGNAHVHALVEVMAGREPPEYVQTAVGG